MRIKANTVILLGIKGMWASVALITLALVIMSLYLRKWGDAGYALLFFCCYAWLATVVGFAETIGTGPVVFNLGLFRCQVAPADILFSTQFRNILTTRPLGMYLLVIKKIPLLILFQDVDDDLIMKQLIRRS